MDRPWFQFFPGDWLHDPDLQACSIEAQGLWINMMCYMHLGEPYGHLRRHGKVILPETLARWVRLPEDRVEVLLQELESYHVFSRDAEGGIYSRRMVKDEKTRLARAAGGVKGGNPMLLKAKKDPERLTSKDNLGDNQPINLQAPLSESKSESKSESDNTPLTPQGGKSRRTRRATVKPEYTPDFLRFWAAYPRKENKVDAVACWLARLAEGISPEDLITAATNYAAQRKGQEERYTLQPTTFLGPKERWVKFRSVEPVTGSQQGGRQGLLALVEGGDDDE